MDVRPCNTYAARPAGTAVHRAGKSVFKLYFVDIYGREHPERFEWRLNGLDPGAVAAALERLGVEGVGFVIAFPHIAKLFRYAPDAEILMLVKAFRPADGESLPLERGEGYVEFACLTEAVIAAAEYRLWAEAATVDDYLGTWCDWGELPIRDNAKLRRYWASA
ncbi:MAG: hypothetical protein HYU66_03620 [Armatimonadetes bacterium]|nr:hypothetical protein [Armatimonadota bacterium]